MLISKIKQLFTTSKNKNTIPLIITNKIIADSFTAFQLASLKNQGYSGQLSPNDYFVLPNLNGEIDVIYVGENNLEFLFTLGSAYQKLPAGDYTINGDFSKKEYLDLLLGFALGAYQFDKYKQHSQKSIRFVIPTISIESALIHAIEAHYLVRDLINEPANELNPTHFSERIRSIFDEDSISIREWKGKSLLDNNFPLIYAVGKASEHEPRLIEVSHTYHETALNLTLIGKGVCFDTGGLDIKPSSGMRLMQKDMGGAAHVIGLARWILNENLPINLRLLIPIVENAISNNAMRPGDIIKARNGLYVEIDNTDAEGRLILADTLSYASESNYDLLIDFATLTGAARIALGPELPAVFSHDDKFTTTILNAGQKNSDPLWRLPLHSGYSDWIKPNHADILNSSKFPYGGAITAGLFLNEFVVNIEKPYIHIDVMAWNIRVRPGRPEGGEAMGLRAVYSAIQEYSANFITKID